MDDMANWTTRSGPGGWDGHSHVLWHDWRMCAEGQAFDVQHDHHFLLQSALQLTTMACPFDSPGCSIANMSDVGGPRWSHCPASPKLQPLSLLVPNPPYPPTVHLVTFRQVRGVTGEHAH